jgi:hypothetical protein
MTAFPLPLLLIVACFFGAPLCRTPDSTAPVTQPALPDTSQTDKNRENLPVDSTDTASTVFHDDTTFDEETDTLPTDTSCAVIATDTAAVRTFDSARETHTDSAALVKKKVRPSWLYPGISLEQDSLALQLLRAFCEFNWAEADKTAKKMQRLEKKERLPPLSYLLQTGIRILRIQKGEYEDDKTKKALIHDVEKLVNKGLELSEPVKGVPDANVVTDKFITGGIKGFLATLEIDVNPVKAAIDGFAAQKLLQETARQDTLIKDAYLGLGLFNCLLGGSPLVLRSALSMVGKDVSLSNGINYLRKVAYNGRYTNDIAKMFLVEFLTPYLGDQAEEKKKVLRSLQKKYPVNPYFTFLELDENICFHPDEVFVFSSTGRIKRQIMRAIPLDYCAKRYLNLVKWQILLADPFSGPGMAPDTTFDLRGFSYYPVFLKAFKEKYLYEKETSPHQRDRDQRLRFIAAEGARARRAIETSETMPAGLKNYYVWHVRDGLRVRQVATKK